MDLGWMRRSCRALERGQGKDLGCQTLTSGCPRGPLEKENTGEELEKESTGLSVISDASGRKLLPIKTRAAPCSEQGSSSPAPAAPRAAPDYCGCFQEQENFTAPGNNLPVRQSQGHSPSLALPSLLGRTPSPPWGHPWAAAAAPAWVLPPLPPFSPSSLAAPRH